LQYNNYIEFYKKYKKFDLIYNAISSSNLQINITKRDFLYKNANKKSNSFQIKTNKTIKTIKT